MVLAVDVVTRLIPDVVSTVVSRVMLVVASTWRLDVELCGGGEVRHRGPQGRHGEGEGRVGHAQRGRGEVGACVRNVCNDIGLTLSLCFICLPFVLLQEDYGRDIKC